MLVWMRLHMDVVWLSQLPPGPKLIACNHPTTTDPFILLTIIPEPIRILITEMAFNVPLFGFYLRRAGHIKVVPEDGRPAFEEAKRRLLAGQTLGIFPEGDLSPKEGEMHPAHSGVARLALSTGVPVIPVGVHPRWKNVQSVETTIRGKTDIARWCLHGHYAMTVGEPIYLAGDPQDRTAVAAAAGQVMARIADLAQSSQKRIHARERQIFRWTGAYRLAAAWAGTVAASLALLNQPVPLAEPVREMGEWLRRRLFGKGPAQA
jgi:1-acyl-sn-glycerol-3-phosphate acyltransferase